MKVEDPFNEIIKQLYTAENQMIHGDTYETLNFKIFNYLYGTI